MGSEQFVRSKMKGAFEAAGFVGRASDVLFTNCMIRELELEDTSLGGGFSVDLPLWLGDGRVIGFVMREAGDGKSIVMSCADAKLERFCSGEYDGGLFVLDLLRYYLTYKG